VIISSYLTGHPDPGVIGMSWNAFVSFVGCSQFIADLPVHPTGVISVRRRGRIVVA